MNIEYEKENLNSVWTRHCPSYNMFCTCFCVGWWCTEEQKHKQRRSDNVAAECLWGGWRGGEPADGGWRRQRWMLSALISPSACDYWGGVCECSRLTWCLCRVCSHISPCEWAFFLAAVWSNHSGQEVFISSAGRQSLPGCQCRVCVMRFH